MADGGPAVVAVARAVHEIEHGVARRALHVARRRVHVRAPLGAERRGPVLDRGHHAVRDLRVVRLERAVGARHLEHAVRADALVRESRRLRIGHARAVDAEVVAVRARLERRRRRHAPQPARVLRHRQPGRPTEAERNGRLVVRARHHRVGRLGRAEAEGHAPVGEHFGRRISRRRGEKPGGRQLVPGLAGGAFCALATDEARPMSSSERSSVSMRMESRCMLRLTKEGDRIAQFISVAPSQCSSALPSTKRHMSNQLVV